MLVFFVPLKLVCECHISEDNELASVLFLFVIFSLTHFFGVTWNLIFCHVNFRTILGIWYIYRSYFNWHFVIYIYILYIYYYYKIHIIIIKKQNKKVTRQWKCDKIHRHQSYLTSFFCHIFEANLWRDLLPPSIHNHNIFILITLRRLLTKIQCR